MLPLRTKVDLGAMAIKVYSAFSKAPALLEPHHKIVLCHIQDTRRGGGVLPLCRGVCVCLIWKATGSLKDLHTWADPCREMRYGEERRVGLFLASSQIQRLKFDVGQWAKHRLSVNAGRPFVNFLGPVTFHGLRKNYIGS